MQRENSATGEVYRQTNGFADLCKVGAVRFYSVTYRMLNESRFAGFFEILGNTDIHYGIFRMMRMA